MVDQLDNPWASCQSDSSSFPQLRPVQTEGWMWLMLPETLKALGISACRSSRYPKQTRGGAADDRSLLHHLLGRDVRPWHPPVSASGKIRFHWKVVLGLCHRIETEARILRCSARHWIAVGREQTFGAKSGHRENDKEVPTCANSSRLITARCIAANQLRALLDENPREMAPSTVCGNLKEGDTHYCGRRPPSRWGNGRDGQRQG